MPLYDFRCEVCGQTFEARSAPEVNVPGPSCSSPETQRVLSGFAGPFTVAPRGAAARRSNSRRAAREEQRQERRERRG